jgi:hypothetical protein
MVNFLNPIPLKVPELVMYACFGLKSLPDTVSMGSETPSTKSMQSETLRQLSQSGVRLQINWVNAEGTNIYKYFIVPPFSIDMESNSAWLSQRGVSLSVDSVDREWDSVSTESLPNVKKIGINRRIQEQNRNHSKALLIGLYMFDKCKKPERKNLMQVYL